MNDDSASLEARVLSIVREECREPDRVLHRDDRLFDLLDSLGKMEVVMALEDEFEMRVPDGDVEGIRTVGDLIDYIGRHVRSRPVGASSAEPDGPLDRA